MNAKKTLTALATALAAAALAPSTAHASTAANTTIVNTATVNFSDAGGTPQTAVTATASVTVTLVPSSPVLSTPADVAISQSTSATLSYTITGTANGSDTYNLAADSTPSANLNDVTPTLPASVVLGGTTLAAAAADGANSITVPYDGTDNANVNNIVVGDTIVIGANAYTVTAIAENAGTNTATITLGAAISGGAVAAGSIVGERQTFDVTVPSGTMTSGSSGTQTVVTTATSATNAAATASDTVVVTVNRAVLTVTKEVSIDDGATFAATANAAPGTSLVYKITVSNGGSSAATAVSITDVIPAYLTYVSGTGKTSTNTAATYSDAGNTALTEGVGGYDYVAGTRTVSYSTASIAGSSSLVLFFRATID